LIVLDSSAAVDYLVGHRHQAEWVRARLLEDDDIHVPHLLDVEVVGAIARLVRTRGITVALAEQALLDLANLDVSRYPHLLLVQRMWDLRANVTAYDAAFVALAETLDAPLVTTDQRLAQAPGLDVEIVAFPG
jgi:predicted nucleic acid-binding protein